MKKTEPNRPTFFSSYGPFEGIKGDTWEGGVHLPAIVWGPKYIPKGTHVSTPAIAYDWASTFIDFAASQPPVRMDGISLLPALTGKIVSATRPLYVEYKNDETTPDYKEFAPQHRGRNRNQMQWIRVGDYVGVRYDIKSADDNFEIYNAVSDPAQHNNLAVKTETKLSAPIQASFQPSNKAAMNINDLQSYMKGKVLQMRISNSSTPRPYDSTYIPSIIKDNLEAGVSWKVYKGSFPWLPRVDNLKPSERGHSATIDINASSNMTNAVTVFSGYLSVPADGQYTFYMSCDAKAFLRIHDIQLIDEDYAYPGNLLREASLFLKAGLHPYHLSYYRHEDSGPPFLKLDWSGPNMPRQRMIKSVLFRDIEEN